MRAHSEEVHEDSLRHARRGAKSNRPDGAEVPLPGQATLSLRSLPVVPHHQQADPEESEETLVAGPLSVEQAVANAQTSGTKVAVACTGAPLSVILAEDAMLPVVDGTRSDGHGLGGAHQDAMYNERKRLEQRARGIPLSRVGCSCLSRGWNAPSRSPLSC